MPARVHLSPDQSVALTRQVLAFCLGKGSMAYYSRAWSFSITHPKPLLEYAHYQRSRLLRLVPTIRPPLWVKRRDASATETDGGYQLRFSSIYLETAYMLAYPNGEYRISSGILEMLGAEAIACLWADRGRIKIHKQRNTAVGLLLLQRHEFDAAELIHDWIFTLTGARARIGRNRATAHMPALWYTTDQLEKLMAALAHTWPAKAECLMPKFYRPAMSPEVLFSKPSFKPVASVAAVLTPPSIRRASRLAYRLPSPQSELAPLAPPSPPEAQAQAVVPPEPVMDADENPDEEPPVMLWVLDLEPPRLPHLAPCGSHSSSCR